MTVKEALDVSQRSVSFREAEVLLAHAMDVTREYLHTHPEKELSADAATRYEDCLRRREDNEPVAYITGGKEFYGRPFRCDARALIPRPETEGLIDQALEILPRRFKEHTTATNRPCPVRILELGTGCGNIAVTLSLELAARHVPAELYATDISAEALSLAQANWQALRTVGAQAPCWIQANLFDSPEIQGKQFDLIVANLPYVPDRWRLDSAAQPEVVFREPQVALFGGEDGLDIYRRFFQAVRDYLQPGGHILIEYNEDQTKNLKSLIRDSLIGAEVEIRQDYAGLDRTALITVPI